MDFEPQYTPEQEEFRQEVKAWMKENMPPGIVHPADPIDLTENSTNCGANLVADWEPKAGSGPHQLQNTAAVDWTWITRSYWKKRRKPPV